MLLYLLQAVVVDVAGICCRLLLLLLLPRALLLLGSVSQALRWWSVYKQHKPDVGNEDKEVEKY